MKNKLKNISAITALVLTLTVAPASFGADKMNKTPAELAGKVYPSVSENLIADFNSESFSWLRTSDSAEIKKAQKPENDADGYVIMDCDAGGCCSLAKNFRALRLPAIAEFKIKCPASGTFTFTVYTRGSFPVRIAEVKNGELFCGNEKIASVNYDEFTKFSFKFDESGKYSVYINEIIAKENAPAVSIRKIDCLSAVGFGFSSAEASSVAVDDAYVYNGNELMDEFSLLGNIDKAIYRTINSVAFVSRYDTVYANRKKSQCPYEAKIIGDKFFVPLAYTLNSLGFEAVYSDGSISVSGEKSSFTIKGSEAVSGSLENPVSLSASAIDLNSELLVCASDVANLFGLSMYSDNEDLIILSKSDSVFKPGDDASLLASLLKTQITNLTYAYDSLGRRVKIGSSAEFFKAKPIEIKEVSSLYVPQPENPPANVADGDFSTRFAYDSNEKTLDIDLGEVKNISAYAISWYNGSVRKNEYILHYSQDGINWSSLPKCSSTGVSDKFEFVTCPIEARYIKYQGLGTYTNAENVYGEWNSVTEIVFFQEDAE